MTGLLAFSGLARLDLPLPKAKPATVHTGIAQLR